MSEAKFRRFWRYDDSHDTLFVLPRLVQNLSPEGGRLIPYLRVTTQGSILDKQHAVHALRLCGSATRTAQYGTGGSDDDRDVNPEASDLGIADVHLDALLVADLVASRNLP